MKEVIVMLKI